jgi:hypothetical protein
LTNLIDAAIGRAIDLKNVYRDSLGNLLTVRALVARSRSRTIFAVQRLGKNPCCRGLSYSAHAGKEIGMSDAIRPDSILQCAGNWLLAGNIRKILRPPFPRDDKVRHIFAADEREKVADSVVTLLILIRTRVARCPLLTARLPCGTGAYPVPLLPSGPDGVRGAALHRT